MDVRFVTTRLIVITGSILAGGCTGLEPSGLFGLEQGGVVAQTVLTSSSLAGSGDSAQSRTVVDGPGGLRITPDNVDGMALSVLFTIDGRDDEGVVVFGDERPDIATSDAQLYEFDMAAQLPIDSSIALQPGFQGGSSSQMALLFGYMDFEFTLDGRTRIVRVALADIEPMRRGDVLLWIEAESSASITPDVSINPPTNSVDADAGQTDEPLASAGFRWFDLDSDEFASVRPDNPAAIAQIRDFNDPIGPTLAYYPINVSLDEPVQLAGDQLLEADSIRVVIDFELSQAITLVNEHFEALSDVELVTTFSLTQILSGFGESGFRASASVEIAGVTADAGAGAATEPTVRIYDLKRGDDE